MVTKVKSGVIGDNTVGITQLNVSDGSNGQALVTNGSGTLSFASVGVTGISSSADATAITIDSSEQVGINNTSPNSYSANARNLVVGSGSGNNGITITSATDGQSRIFFADGTSGGAEYDGFVYYDHASQLMSFGTGATGTQSLNIDSTGKVGIGKTAPEESLHVVGDVVLDDVAPKIYFQTGSTHYNWKVSTQDAVNKGFEIASGEVDGDANSDTFTRRLVIEGDTGCVGIGMDDPTAKLDVQGTNFAGYALKVNNTGTGGANHGVYINTGSTSAYNIVSQQNGTTKWFNTGDHTWFDANFAIGHTTTTASSTNKAWTPQAGLSVKQGVFPTMVQELQILLLQIIRNLLVICGHTMDAQDFKEVEVDLFKLSIPDVNGAAGSVGYGGFSVEIYLSGYSGKYAHCFVSGYVNAGITIGETAFRATGGSHSVSYGSVGTQGFYVDINIPSSYTHGCAYWRVTKGGNSADAQWTKLDDTIAYWS